MTTAEAKMKISQEFIARFHQWLADEVELSDTEYGRKYGYGKAAERHGENMKSLMSFQKYFFSGRYLKGWEDAGYDKKDIWKLAEEGFLSRQEYSNWEARMTGRTVFYYISQKTAKEIYKELKEGEHNET